MKYTIQNIGLLGFSSMFLLLWGCAQDHAVEFEFTDEYQDSSISANISLRIVPPEDSGYEELQVTNLTVTSNEVLSDFTINSLTQVDGHVSYVDSIGEVADVDGAVVTFYSQGEISGYPILRTVTTSSNVNERGQFNTALIQGSYEVTVDVPDMSIPPFRISQLEVTGSSLTFDISLPNPDTNFLIQGELLRQTDYGEQVPLDGARVVFLNPHTGVVMSTEAVTVGGRFSVRVLPIEANYIIRLGPNSGEPIPDLVIGEILVQESMDIGQLVLEEWGEVFELYGAAIMSSGSAEGTFSGTTVFLEQELDNGTFSQVAFTDAQGQFDVQIIPGEYSILLIPPADLDLAAAKYIEALEDDITSYEFELSVKPRLIGYLERPNGQPASSVLVTAIPQEFEMTMLSLGPSTTVSDSNGLFLLPLQYGKHRLVILPPEHSDIRPMVIDNLILEGDRRLDVRMSSSHHAQGRVLTPDGIPLAGVMVEVFSLIQDDTEKITEVYTDEMGEFVIDIPLSGRLN
jgi:hypothetical protein